MTMTNETQNTNARAQLYFGIAKLTGEFIGIRHGENGFSSTTIYDLGHCTVMNARQGNTPGQIEAAQICSMFGTWGGFTQMAVELDAKGQGLHNLVTGDKLRLVNTSGQSNELHALDALGVEWVTLPADESCEVTICSYEEGLIRVKRGSTEYLGLFSYMNGQSCNEASQGFKLESLAPKEQSIFIDPDTPDSGPQDCEHDQYCLIDHPDGTPELVPFCPACDEIVEL
jgi:hypothetical protein